MEKRYSSDEDDDGFTDSDSKILMCKPQFVVGIFYFKL